MTNDLNVESYPVLLFTVSQDNQKVGLYRYLSYEGFKAMSDNADELAELLEGEGYDDIFRDNDDTENESTGEYFRSIEQVRTAIKKDYPRLVLGKVEVGRNWHPLFSHGPTLVDTRD